MLRQLADLNRDRPLAPILVDEAHTVSEMCESGRTPCLISIVVARNELRTIKRLYEDFERDVIG